MTDSLRDRVIAMADVADSRMTYEERRVLALAVAALAVAHEREACALTCEKLVCYASTMEYNGPILHCVAAIRARGETL